MKAVAVKNDYCRKYFIDCEVVMTPGVSRHEDRSIILKTVREFNIFNQENDPYGEHDFGSFSLNGQLYFWKIDYYDDQFTFFKEDGKRVLTIGRSDEY